MAIADTHHPVVLDISKVWLHYICVLVWFLLAGNKSLTCLHRVLDDRALASTDVLWGGISKGILLVCDIKLILVWWRLQL
jgi:hypothetical protein